MSNQKTHEAIRRDSESHDAKIARLTAATAATKARLDAEKARGNRFAVHQCAHCEAICKIRYTFCFGCMQSLPKPLREGITRNRATGYDHWAVRHWRAVETAAAYLAQDDRAAYTREQAERGVGWAIDALMDAGELDHAGQMQILRRNAAKQEQNHD